MKISVIVPFLNEEKYLNNCLNSLVNQTLPKDQYELIFIDNNSTDRSREVVKKYKKVILLSETKPGEFFARNKGLKIAKGEIVAFTCADSVVGKNWLVEMLESFKNKKTVIVTGYRYFKNPGFGLKLLEFFENEKTYYMVNYMPRDYWFAVTNNMAVRRSSFLTAGFFSEKIPVVADTEMTHRLLDEFPESSIFLNPDAKVIHLEVRSSFEWIKKFYGYGENYSILTSYSSFKPFSSVDNLKAYLQTVRRHKLGFLQATVLLSLLGLKSAAYKAGSAFSKLETIK